MNRAKLKFAAYVLACSCVGVSALALPWLCWEKPDVQNITRLWFDGKAENYMTDWRSLDTNVRSIAGNGNIALRLVGFAPGQTTKLSILQELYDRGSYTLYPQRILATDKSTVIGSAEDLIIAKFDPPPQWCQENNVRAVVQATRTPAGTIEFRPMLPPTGGGR